MNLIMENQGTNKNLVYSLTAHDEIDELSLGMIVNNKIDGIIPIQFIQLDIEKQFKFNVTGKTKIAKLFLNLVGKEMIVEVFIGIIDAILNANKYMIDENRMLLDMEHVYIDEETKKIELICLPVVRNYENTIRLDDFFKNIMFKTKFSQEENCDYVAKIINYLNATTVFSLESFKVFLKDDMKDVVNVQPKPQVEEPKIAEKAEESKPKDFGESAYIVSVKDGQKTYINKNIFKVGRKREIVDYYIKDNSAIGRCHAHIIKINNEYFVVDMNSTNHTFVDGMKIDKNKNVKLVNETRIRFANEDFVFYID